MMFRKLRKIPPVCLFISLLRLIAGRLSYSKQYLGDQVIMGYGREFTVFRHITTHPPGQSSKGCVFIVSFKFTYLSHRANKIASIIPMLLITDFPGFVSKIYAVNYESVYWQGMYQWKSMKHLEEYKKSFVYRMMNKRAIKDTIKSVALNHKKLSDFIEEHTVRVNIGILRKNNNVQ